MSAEAPVRWGVLGTARIAVQKVIPGFQRSGRSTVLAIGSREGARATAAAAALGVPRAYGSYAAVLDDPDVEAVYIPLPNHLHVEWAARAAACGKHVLCEKPLAMSAAEAERLIEVRDRHRVILQEAFMIRTHPQWLLAIGLVRDARRWATSARSSASSPKLHHGPREHPQHPRGGRRRSHRHRMLSHARRALGVRPRTRPCRRGPGARSGLGRRSADIPAAGLRGRAGDRHLRHPARAPDQRVHIHGTRARLEIEIPFYAHQPPDSPCRVCLDDGSDLRGAGVETMSVGICDQYRRGADAFAAAVRDGAAPAVSLESSIGNMRVLDALVRSSSSGRWEVSRRLEPRRGVRTRASDLPPWTWVGGSAEGRECG